MPKELYRHFVSPILDKLDSETWHHRAVEALHFAESTPFTLKLLEQFAAQRKRFTHEKLRVVLGGIELENPLLVGAGWDKAGRAVQALSTLGFSGVEVGTITAQPQPGNPKPRQFLIGPGVALNRLGFNSPGMGAVAHNLERYHSSGIPLGISLGINKNVSPQNAAEAHALVAKHLYRFASYFAINVSSPNTPGLRQLLEKEPLYDIVQAVNAALEEMGDKKPVFVKVSPDLSLSALDDVIRVVADTDLAGIIATNTTVRSDIKASYGARWEHQIGGVSGNDPIFRQMATNIIAHISRETAGSMEIIGGGGVKDATTTLEKIRAGARVVQIVTAIRSEGPSLPGTINREIVAFMEREGINTLDEIRGSTALR